MNKNLKKITVTGLFSAMIFVLTMFVKVTVPSGYVHLGDAMIYICAVLLGSPWALIAGALGEGLADVAGSLPAAMNALGHDCRVVMPYYSQIRDFYDSLKIFLRFFFIFIYSKKFIE